MSGRKLKGFDIFIIILFLSGALISLDMFRRDLNHTFTLQNVDPVGTVVVKKNTVQRRLSDRVIWDRLMRESPVYIGDLIRVADVSAATLYIQKNSIELLENTIVRITSASDGDGFQIEMSQGNVTVYSQRGAGRIRLDINGMQVNVESGTAVNAVAAGNRMPVINVSQSLEQLRGERSASAGSAPVPLLVSPAANSVIRNLPVVNFQWTEVEDALSYTLEVSGSPDFSGIKIKRDCYTTSFTDSDLGDGVWFWRVTPVFSSLFAANAVPSAAGFFSVDRQSGYNIDFSKSIAQWLLEEAPSMELPPGIPPELIPAHLIKKEPPPEPEPEPSPPPPPPRLAAPQNMRPVRGAVLNHTQLQSQRSISFSWSPVQGANSYIFTLYNLASSGRRQVVRTTVSSTNYTLTNLRLLDRGVFIWQAEPVYIRRGVIERRGNVTENLLTIEFPVPGPIQIEDTGILYGN